MKINMISTIVFICGLMSAIIAIYAWHNRATRGSKLLSAFMASMTVYVMGYSMELASLNLPSMLFWSKIGYLGIFSFPTLFLIFVLQYTGRDKWLTRRNILLMFLIPTFLLVCKFTDDNFHLVYGNTWVDTSGLIPSARIYTRPYLSFGFIYLYTCQSGDHITPKETEVHPSILPGTSHIDRG